MVRLAILGVAGSGKGTMTSSIAEYYNLKHVVVGDIVKQEIRNKTELGKIMYEHTSKGKFVPSEIVIQVLQQQVADYQGFDGYIIDTAPINIEQKRLMKDIPLDAVILLDIQNFDIVRERTLSRLICPKCRNVTSIKEVTDGICPKCGAVLEKRYDDNIDTVNVRINQYLERTVPVINEFRDENKLITVNAERTKDVVFAEIITSIDAFFGYKR